MTIFKKLPASLQTSLAACLCFLFLPATWQASDAQTFITAVDQGQYESTGAHFPSNNNYLTGNNEGLVYRSFFVFDIPAFTLSEEITAASLRLNTHSVTLNNFSSATLVFRAFTGNITALRSPPGFISYPNYTSLASGTEVATATFSSADANTILIVNFNSAGVGWLESNRNGRVAVSGIFPASESLYSGQNFIFAMSGLQTAQMSITTAPIPEPAVAGLFAVIAAPWGIIWHLKNRRCRRRGQRTGGVGRMRPAKSSFPHSVALSIHSSRVRQWS